jgi:hypothetical protein
MLIRCAAGLFFMPDFLVVGRRAFSARAMVDGSTPLCKPVCLADPATHSFRANCLCLVTCPGTPEEPDCDFTGSTILEGACSRKDPPAKCRRKGWPSSNPAAYCSTACLATCPSGPMMTPRTRRAVSCKGAPDLKLLKHAPLAVSFAPKAIAA